MKVEIKHVNEEDKFPAFYQALGTGAIAMFFAKGQPGQGVWVSGEHVTTGRFSDVFTDYADVGVWKRLPAGTTVTLTQE